MLRTLITNLFGSYAPITFTDVDSVDVIPSGCAGMDWEWIAGVALFAITLYSVFRLIGGLIKK